MRIVCLSLPVIVHTSYPALSGILHLKRLWRPPACLIFPVTASLPPVVVA